MTPRKRDTHPHEKRLSPYGMDACHEIKGHPRLSLRRRLRLSDKGWTLIELMLVTALIGIIVPSITALFTKLAQAMASDEMHLQLLTLNEQTQLRLHERLIAGRHLCQNNASGTAYLTKVTAGLSSGTATNYPVLGGSKLPLVQPFAPVPTPNTFSPVYATRANFGNCLLFAVYDFPQTFGNPMKKYAAPATIAGAGITYGAGGPATFIMNLYRFYYYYLTSANPKTIRGVATYRLMEWQSIQYADYNELADISDGTLRQEIINWLATAGNVNPGSSVAVTCAWDPTASDPTSNAFYSLSAATSVASPINPGSIAEAVVTPLTRITSGILSQGFSYGIGPNEAMFADSPADVPQYAVSGTSGAATQFPGGFEVGVSGNSAGRQVLIRSLLVAKGAAPRVSWNDQTMVHNMRDVW